MTDSGQHSQPGEEKKTSKRAGFASAFVPRKKNEPQEAASATESPENVSDDPAKNAARFGSETLGELPNPVSAGQPDSEHDKSTRFTAETPENMKKSVGNWSDSSKSVITSSIVHTVVPRRKQLIFDKKFEIRRFVVFLLLVVLGLWSYWPSVVSVVGIWHDSVDYHHGFFIVPLTLFFLWLRRDTYPGTCKKLAWIGLLPLLFCVLMRYRAGIRFEEAVENWSILFWIFGTVWFLYGSRTFLWALPSLAFLCFMLPLPYRFEVEARQVLQSFAAMLATGMLQILGEPAVRLGNTIHIGSVTIGVEEACSGIRFLISFFAIAFGAILLMRRPLWQNVLVFLAVIPVALLANAARIAMTSLLLIHARETMARWASANQSAGAYADHLAGSVTIVLSVLVFVGLLLYLGKVYRQVDLYQTPVK